jgi:cell wall-associated NlpC family hydrolase
MRSVRSPVGESVRYRPTGPVNTATKLLGVPYRRGGTTLDTGFDCSGFVRAAFHQAAGLLLPRRAEDQAAATARIDKHSLQPGDLVFFNTRRRSYSHVGIYVGDGNFIHSPRTGSHVRIDSINGRYWLQRFSGARRVLIDDDPDSGAVATKVLTEISYSIESQIDDDDVNH